MKEESTTHVNEPLPPDSQCADPNPTNIGPSNIFERRETVLIYTVMYTSLIYIAAWLAFETYLLHVNFTTGVHPNASPDSILVLTSAAGIVVVKIASLYLGFVICTFGCLLVMKGVQNAGYRLSADLQDGPATLFKVSLATSSPGLATITLGCAIVALSLFTKASVRTSPIEPRPTQTNDYTNYQSAPTPPVDCTQCDPKATSSTDYSQYGSED